MLSGQDSVDDGLDLPEDSPQPQRLQSDIQAREDALHHHGDDGGGGGDGGDDDLKNAAEDLCSAPSVVTPSKVEPQQ